MMFKTTKSWPSKTRQTFIKNKISLIITSKNIYQSKKRIPCLKLPFVTERERYITHILNTKKYEVKSDLTFLYFAILIPHPENSKFHKSVLTRFSQAKNV